MNEFDGRAASKQFSRVGWGIFAFIAVALIFEVAVLAVLLAVRSPLLKEAWFTVALGIAAMYVFGLLAAVAVINHKPAAPLPLGRKMTPAEFLTAFCMVIGLTYAGNIIGNILMLAAQTLLHKSIENPLDGLLNGSALWIQLISLLVVAPLLEEFLFRKCIVRALAGYSHTGAILVSALAFGLCHGNFYQFFYAFSVGLLFAYLYLRTGRLRYTVALHFLVNFLGGAMPLLLNKGFTAAEGPLLFWQENASALVALLLYVFLMWGIAIAGVVLLIIRRKDFRLPARRPLIPAGMRFRAVFVNSGMILTVLVGLLLFAYSLFGQYDLGA